MFNNILLVCVGNICRSPIAEQIFKNRFPEKNISSAGISVDKSGLSGSAANESALKIAKKNGVDISSHLAKQLTSEICSKFDLILVMEKGHISALSEICPEARGKTMLLTQWLNKEDIPDPYRQSEEAFEYVFDIILKSVSSWENKI
ncbi:low molecular weight phosphotyrosine protein phosphatase [Vibrio fluvialis]|uniref:low molecular weight protein-tyrosine-phosphatase n=1 Tax=Vibrio TaxID=662 RepID=UPI000CD0EB36|nr:MULTISPECIES: low molecular weight protein-tyrosine-phosphatase [Vibrio]EKO3483722.1 low molecular weight phosphotyrosine protein phosphatase [Vibrio fluvialis]ELK3678675.1 low molecular weight phosphotyrosine protein phosphatase [Vibrio fluvialis]EMA2448323.1 low molecular weight phosphotyrosine protein phosphatase [Vibrio fluvialis]MBY8039698.1 low molecular weight phosphotyrosine protein phosphatase [Vibrio fluvialis]POB87962.1 phosphotyrosine protein phosphatase [Vibrio vulnificus]